MAGNSKSKRKSAGTKKPGVDGFRPVSVVTVKSKTEIAEEDYRLKAIPLQALEKFRDGIASTHDWRSIRFRLLVGAEIARELFAKVTQDGMADALNAIELIEVRFIESHGTRLKATAMELELMRMGLEATDEMQDATNSKTQLAAYKAVEKVINSTKRVHHLKNIPSLEA